MSIPDQHHDEEGVGGDDGFQSGHRFYAWERPWDSIISEKSSIDASSCWCDGSKLDHSFEAESEPIDSVWIGDARMIWESRSSSCNNYSDRDHAHSRIWGDEASYLDQGKGGRLIGVGRITEANEEEKGSLGLVKARGGGEGEREEEVVGEGKGKGKGKRQGGEREGEGEVEVEVERGGREGGNGGGRAARVRVSELSLYELSQYWGMPIAEAAKKLEVGMTALKHKCREFGIDRWPHRKLKSLDTLICNIQQGSNRKSGITKDPIQIMQIVRKLEEKKRHIEVKPTINLDPATKRLRQATFKSRHKAKCKSTTMTIMMTHQQNATSLLALDELSSTSKITCKCSHN